MKGPESAMIEVHELPAPVRGLAVASFGMSFFSMIVFWWIPYGILLASAATILAFSSIALGVRSPVRGLYYALGAIALSGTAITTALLCTKLSELIFVRWS